MRVLSNIMVEERDKIYKKIDDLNFILKPKNFVKHIQELEAKDQYLKYLEIDDKNTEIDKALLEFQEVFLKCFYKKIEKASTKQEIVLTIYQFRYYLLLPFNIEKNVIEKVNDNKDIEKILKENLNAILEKAKNLKAIFEVCKNSEYEYEIWKNIFQLRVIKLEDLSLKLTKDNGKYFMQVFDEDAFEEKTQIFVDKVVNEKQIKFNKKIKLFE